MTETTKRLYIKLSCRLLAKRDPQRVANIKPIIKPKEGEKMALMPPPDVKMGNPMRPRIVYKRIANRLFFKGKRRADRKTNNV